MDPFQMRKKIKRDKPNKKWTEEEIKMILNYLQKTPEIEAPTAQIYYKKLIEKTKIDASWDLIRWKVRHLKATFKKAIDWKKSTGAELLEYGAATSSVEGKILQMCPHYIQLNEIFGEKAGRESIFAVTDSGDSTTMDVSIGALNDQLPESPLLIELTCGSIAEDEPCSPPEEIYVKQEQFSPEHVSNESSPVQNSSIAQKTKDFTEKIKIIAPKSSSGRMGNFQAERMAMLKMKFEWEKGKQEKELMLNERKMKLDEEKAKSDIDFRKQELELKLREIEKDEKLKILEIEKDERLRKYELELKYCLYFKLIPK